MSETVQIKRKIFAKNSFENVVNTKFTELISDDANSSNTDSITIDKFFTDYDNIFYSIPVSGSNSHLELVNRSSDYIGIGFLDLQEEIINLRSENVSLKNQLLTLSNGTQ